MLSRIVLLLGVLLSLLAPPDFWVPEPWVPYTLKPRSLLLAEEAPEFAKQTLEYDREGSRVIFSVYRPNILRVRVLSKGAHSAWNPALAKLSPQKVNSKVSTSGETHSLSTAALRVEVNPKTQAYEVFAPTGDLLLGAAPASFANSLTFSHPAGQNFYGVRSHFANKLRGDSIIKFHYLDQGYATAPFIWTTAGYGILGNFQNGNIKFEPSSFQLQVYGTANFEYFVILGKPAEIFADMSELSGRSPMLPKYAFGFSHSEWGSNQRELIRDIQGYRKREIPVDTFFIDYNWFWHGEDDDGDFRWNEWNFPDGPSGLLCKNLREQYGIKIVTIRKPWLGANTSQVREAEKLGFIYLGQQGNKREFNFDSQVARNWWWKKSAHLLGTGIVGYWNDEAENYSPYRFTNWQRTYYEGQRGDSYQGPGKEQRVWSINRIFQLGAQRYGYVQWTGDRDSSFASMAEQRGALLSSINVGVPWWSMDVGGFDGIPWWTGLNWFQGSPSFENYARWMQFGAFVPIYRVHGRRFQEREPWKFGAKAEAVAKKFIRLRYSLLPYIYSSARKTAVSGLPFVRPLTFDFWREEKVVDDVRQWMFGDFLLVRPVVEKGAEKVSLYLPEGNWIDFWTKKRLQGGRELTQEVDADTWSDIPIFIREGAIIPTQKVANYVAEKPLEELVVDIYPSEQESSFLYYDDDGLTYRYEKGDFYELEFKTRLESDRVFFSSRRKSGIRPLDIERYKLRFHLEPSVKIVAVETDGKWQRIPGEHEQVIEVLLKAKEDLQLAIDLEAQP